MTECSSSPTPRVNVGAVMRGESAILYVQAALADATPEQQAEIQTEVLSVLQSPNMEADDAMGHACDEISRIMGEDWLPNDEWQAKFDRLVNSRPLIEATAPKLPIGPKGGHVGTMGMEY